MAIEHWTTAYLIGANASFQRAAREYAEEYAAMAVAAERERCAAGAREAGTEIAAALPAMREYARKNPKHHFSLGGVEQDPNGAHAWLARNENASSGGKPDSFEPGLT